MRFQSYILNGHLSEKMESRVDYEQNLLFISVSPCEWPFLCYTLMFEGEIKHSSQSSQPFSCIALEHLFETLVHHSSDPQQKSVARRPRSHGRAAWLLLPDDLQHPPLQGQHRWRTSALWRDLKASRYKWIHQDIGMWVPPNTWNKSLHMSHALLHMLHSHAVHVQSPSYIWIRNAAISITCHCKHGFKELIRIIWNRLNRSWEDLAPKTGSPHLPRVPHQSQAVTKPSSFWPRPQFHRFSFSTYSHCRFRGNPQRNIHLRRIWWNLWISQNKSL